MIRLSLNRWRGQTESPSVIQVIRRKIRGSIDSHRTVLVDFEGADVTSIEAAQIMAGWDVTSVKGCGSIYTLPQALPADVRIGVFHDDRPSAVSGE